MQPTQAPQSGNEEDQQGLYRPAQPSVFAAVPARAAAAPVEQPHTNVTEVVDWEASEYLHRRKDPLWIFGYVIVMTILVGLAIWAQVWTLAVLLVAVAVAGGFFAFREPHTIHYVVSHNGIEIAGKLHNFSEFKSFGVKAEDAFFSLLFIPVKRFKPNTVVYFAEDDGERLVDILGTHLPMEELQPDPIDDFMRRIHF